MNGSTAVNHTVHVNTDDTLSGIRRRLTLIAVGVLVIAVIDGLFFLTHPETEWHDCKLP